MQTTNTNQPMTQAQEVEEHRKEQAAIRELERLDRSRNRKRNSISRHRQNTRRTH